MDMRHSLKQQQSTLQKGFTLIEVMVVIVILGILAALVVPKLFGQLTNSRVKTTSIAMSTTAGALKMFYLDNSRYPTTQEGLDALVHKPANVKVWHGGYLESLPKDGWDNEFQYVTPGSEGKPFDLYSFGADAKEGGADDDADIYYKP